MKSTITVITVTFNAANLLPGLIDSLRLLPNTYTMLAKACKDYHLLQRVEH